MNPFDVLLGLILGYCLIRGIFRGLVKEMSSIIGVLGGFYAGYSYYPQLARLLAHWITNVGYRNLIAFLAIFCLVFLVVSLFGVVIKHLMNIVFLGWADRLGGALFGACKGVLIAGVLIMVFTAFLPRNNLLIKQSLIARHLSVVSEGMVHLTSKDIRQLFDSKIKDFKRVWNQ